MAVVSESAAAPVIAIARPVANLIPRDPKSILNTVPADIGTIKAGISVPTVGADALL